MFVASHSSPASAILNLTLTSDPKMKSHDQADVNISTCAVTGCNIIVIHYFRIFAIAN